MAAKNCAIRSLTCIGTRQHGVSLRPAWLDAAGLADGETIGIDRREGEYADRAVALYLSEYDPAAVDYEATLGERNGSIYVSLPPGIREWLDAELKESLYLSLATDGETVLVEAP